MNKISKLSKNVLKQIDYFKIPVQLLISRKDYKGEKSQYEDVGSIWGGFLTMISFTFLIVNGSGLYDDMMHGTNDNIKTQIIAMETHN